VQCGEEVEVSAQLRYLSRTWNSSKAQGLCQPPKLQGRRIESSFSNINQRKLHGASSNVMCHGNDCGTTSQETENFGHL